MPYNGSGQFNRLYSWIAQDAAGFDIDPVKVDAEDTGFASGLSNAICKDGQSTVTASIPLGGFNITGLADPVNAQDGATKNFVDNNIPAATIIGGLLFGLTLSNDIATPNTVIDIAAGSTISDDQTTIITETAITKTTGAWVIGGGNGGLDTGAVGASTWYHVFAITGSGGTDALLSTSATAPTMPSGFTKKRRIGSFKTDGSSHIIAFSQNGDEFLWLVAVQDINTTTQSTTPVSYTLSVPLGVKVNAMFRGSAESTGPFTEVLFNSLDQTSVVATSANANVVAVSSGFTGLTLTIRTNTSSQIRGVATGITTIAASTYGWTDTRGKYQ